MKYFGSPEIYNRVGFALSNGNKKVEKLVTSIEKTYTRVNELCLMFNYKRATHYAIVLKYLVDKLKKEVDEVDVLFH
ncbi:hypothetical protein FACS1894132_05320 [Clostridia bacterium]|nr:hypothetical protein FACS1894132_05320 [Clostridia bacterium]